MLDRLQTYVTVYAPGRRNETVLLSGSYNRTRLDERNGIIPRSTSEADRLPHDRGHLSPELASAAS